MILLPFLALGFALSSDTTEGSGGRHGDRWVFWKSCPRLTRAEVEEQSRMIATARKVTYRTFREKLGAEELDQWAEAHGYATGAERGLHQSRDPYVAYYTSTWKGRPCLFLVWSAMEMIWRRESAIDHDYMLERIR